MSEETVTITKPAPILEGSLTAFLSAIDKLGKGAVPADFTGIDTTAYDPKVAQQVKLQTDAAARAAEIEDNKLSLNDIIGLSTSYDNTTEIGPYTYGGFGISVPSAEEAREKLGKPLLQQIDVTTELGKIIDDLEAGRIDASQEILARTAAAQEFKRNFMVFEENF